MPRSTLHAAWAEFLGRLSWELMVTLTFDPKRIFPVARARAEREAWRWCAALGWIVGRPVGWLYVADRGASGIWHVHGLLIGVGEAGWKAAYGVWEGRNGRGHARRVFEGNAAVLYVTKNAWDQGDVTLSDTLERYRDQVGEDVVVKLCVAEARGAGGGMETETATIAVQRVAQDPESIAARVRQLRELAQDMMDRYLVLALGLYQEHEAELWTKVRAQTGERYQSEEEFWEEAVGVKRLCAVAARGPLAGLHPQGLPTFCPEGAAALWMASMTKRSATQPQLGTSQLPLSAVFLVSSAPTSSMAQEGYRVPEAEYRLVSRRRRPEP